MANPTLLKTPIASGGDKNVIPETTGITTGLLSQEKGWQQINSLPINAGGIAPSRLDFNGVFNLLSNILFYTQKGWQWEFDETQSYFAGCTVKDTADGKTYVCIADVNASTTHPSSDTTHWQLSDLATKGDLANYLPLAGGQISGTITYNSDSATLEIMGGKTKGAYLDLRGKDNPSGNGTFSLAGYGDNLYAPLVGTPTGNNAGTLTWCGANVLTDANGGYLPLSGGAMIGSITRNVDNSYLELGGGSSGNNGAYIQLRGKSASSYGGNFFISAKDGTNTCELAGTPLGSLRWNGNDLAGVATVAKSLGTTGYSKRADGLIIQWGYITPSGTSVADVSVLFPISFPNACFGVYGRSVGTSSEEYTTFIWIQINSLTTSGFKFTRMGTNVETGRYWFAIGY